jgi:hypothetical protein
MMAHLSMHAEKSGVYTGSNGTSMHVTRYWYLIVNRFNIQMESDRNNIFKCHHYRNKQFSIVEFVRLNSINESNSESINCLNTDLLSTVLENTMGLVRHQRLKVFLKKELWLTKQHSGKMKTVQRHPNLHSSQTTTKNKMKCKLFNFRYLLVMFNIK